MKTILVATDYSKAASNALQYAIELAKFSKAKLVLFHAYDIPVPVTEFPAVIPVAIHELEEENRKAITTLENKIRRQAAGKFKVESYISSGLPVQEILGIIKKQKADLVVTGIRGAGKVSEALIGSTATSVMKKTHVPVLAVPLKSKFKKSNKIVLAYDYQKIIKPGVIKHIKEFARLFNARLLVLNVVKLYEEPGYYKASALVKLKGALKGIKHDFFFPSSENITQEINLFIKKQKAGMLVMMPHKHDVLEKLFYPSNTRHMAFNTDVPLLSLHD